MSCMSTFGHSCSPTKSKSWTFVLDLILLLLLTQLKVKVFDILAAYNKFLCTIFLFLPAPALVGKLIPGKGFQYFHVNFVFGVKVDAVCYHLLESGKMKSKSLINSILGAKKCCCLDLFEISLIIVYMNMRLPISQISNYQDSGYIHGVGLNDLGRC